MTLADFKNYIFRRTKTNSTSFTAADMVIGLNNGLERAENIIREYLSEYQSTRWTTSDLSTGTATPKFNSRFHEIIPLWVVYQWSADNDKVNSNAIFQEILIKEKEARDFYGLRNYKPFTVTIASPGVFTTRHLHELKLDDRVSFETTGAVPTGLTAETTWYYVVSTPTDRTFTVSATKRGTAINTSGSQSGTHYYTTENINRLHVGVNNTDSNR